VSLKLNLFVSQRCKDYSNLKEKKSFNSKLLMFSHYFLYF